MGSAELKKEEIRLREVYLEDLKSVMVLYHNSLASVKHINGFNKQLTSDFGLPIGIAEKSGKVIAYSRVNIDSKGKPVFQIHSNETGNPPLRLLLGAAALKNARKKIEELTNDFDAWEKTTIGADFPKS